MPSDLGSTAYSETAASNNQATPNGWPAGMNGSQVEPTARENMAGLKRWYNRSQPTTTTGGTTTAYTLTNTVAEAAYYAGQIYSFIINATCGNAPTLNIDGLGAHNIRKFSGGAWTNCIAGDLQANEVIECYYNSGATTFDIVAQPPITTWQALDSQTLSGASSYSLQSISTSINHLQIIMDLQVSTNASNLLMQFYNSSGVLDSGGSSYFYLDPAWDTSGAANSIGTATTSSILIAGSVSNGTNFGVSGDLVIPNMQGVKYTQCNWRVNFLNSGGSLGIGVTGFGGRLANGNITGVKIFPSAGTISGRLTLLGTAN